MDEIDAAQQKQLDLNEVVDAKQARQIDWLTWWLFVFAGISALGSFFQAWEAFTVWWRLK